MTHDKDCPWSDPETGMSPVTMGLPCTCQPQPDETDDGEVCVFCRHSPPMKDCSFCERCKPPGYHYDPEATQRRRQLCEEVCHALEVSKETIAREAEGFESIPKIDGINKYYQKKYTDLIERVRRELGE